MEVKDYIISESDNLFCQHGFKSVTMDDLAKHLGMSKKTIYTHFSDKNEIVNMVIENKLSYQKCVIREGSENAENAVHELFFAVTNMQELLSNMHPNLFYDLQKYHPQAWLSFKNFRQKCLYETIYNNLMRGIKEGYYRSDIKCDILTQMRLEQIDLIFSNSSAYTNGRYGIAQVMVELTEHFLYGVCSIKGHKLINKYKEINEEE
ncbi:MAG: TetR/AcrR family transcriptional regulator [Daejeonella sp.]|uniref:TetR/AcrR family transcriptional regulator n=1 Tax=Daejeonella sp. JGW-45 TaxID=3034148 RepID=UPI0023EDF003|nr:TetR/AcrR family transcriptional regulator [Daejeonella sp. JGW-45]